VFERNEGVLLVILLFGVLSVKTPLSLPEFLERPVGRLRDLETV
jgi:hypothetical protein